MYILKNYVQVFPLIIVLYVKIISEMLKQMCYYNLKTEYSITLATSFLVQFVKHPSTCKMLILLKFSTLSLPLIII